MKILKYILLAGGLLLLGFLLIPVIVPTITIESRIVVEKQAELAWAVFIDTSNMPRWLSGYKAMETISGEPNTVGSRYRYFFEEDGREIIMTEEITAFSHGELMAFTMENEMMANNTSIRFIPKGNITEIVATTEMDGKGIIWGGLLPLMKPMIVQRTAGDYGKLKEVIDSAP
jgi:uncharacterized membrane protein